MQDNYQVFQKKTPFLTFPKLVTSTLNTAPKAINSLVKGKKKKKKDKILF